MKSTFLFLVVAFLFLSNCKPKSDQKEEDQDSETTEKTMDDISEQAEDAADEMKKLFDGKGLGKDVQLVEIADLKALLPEELNGMDRENYKGEGVGALGFKMNKAEAEYQKGDKRLKLDIIDFGGFGPAMLGLAAWSVTNVYHEDDNGYEKVTEWKGYKVFEKSNRKNKTSSLSIIYKNRLIVNAEADDMNIADLKELLEDEILDELDDLDIPSEK